MSIPSHFSIFSLLIDDLHRFLYMDAVWRSGVVFVRILRFFLFRLETVATIALIMGVWCYLRWMDVRLRNKISHVATTLNRPIVGDKRRFSSVRNWIEQGFISVKDLGKLVFGIFSILIFLIFIFTILFAVILCKSFFKIVQKYIE